MKKIFKIKNTKLLTFVFLFDYNNKLNDLIVESFFEMVAYLITFITMVESYMERKFQLEVVNGYSQSQVPTLGPYYKLNLIHFRVLVVLHQVYGKFWVVANILCQTI